MDWQSISPNLEEELHDMVVERVARERLTFPFNEYYPGQFYPSWRVFTNVPQQQMGVEHKWRGLLYPNVVIVDSEKCNAPMLVCEVETPRSLSIDALERWKLLQDTCRTLYVYVPEGYARQAFALIYDFRICFPTAVRTYGFDEVWNLRYTCV